MRALTVALGERSYPILIGERLLEQVGALLAQRMPIRRAVVVTNPVVAGHWLDRLERSLAAAGIAARNA